MGKLNENNDFKQVLKHMFNPSAAEIARRIDNNIDLYGTKCWECKTGHFVLRKGPYGPFGGCSKFPECKKTVKYNTLAYSILKSKGMALYEWKTKCWKCNKDVTLISYFPELDDTDISKIPEFKYVRLGFLREIDLYLENRYSSIRTMYSKTAKFFYTGNVCPHSRCQQLQGMAFSLKDMYEFLSDLSVEDRKKYIVEYIPVGEILRYENFVEYFEEMLKEHSRINLINNGRV